MKTTLILAGAAAVTAANLKPREFYERLFFDHMEKYSLKFANGDEFANRLQIFADMVDTIETHNAGQHTYTLGLNQYSHLTFDEFKQAVNLGATRPPSLRRSEEAKIHDEPADMSTIPSAVDWVASGKVTGVKNQGSCGSCWSFSTTGSLEGAYAIKYNSLVSFSEQNLVSCDKTDYACNGGWMDTAFTWVKNNGGIATETAYPYVSGAGSVPACNTAVAKNADAAPKSFTDVTVNNVNALASAVAQQPVSIAIQANQPAFQSYKSGVFTGTCGQKLDHGVLAVGYGTEGGVDYWKVKNSWGTTWGENGYIRIEKSSANRCGVLSAPSYPNL